MIALSVKVEWVAVRCPVCGRRQPFDAEAGSKVSATCVRCGLKFEREVRG